MFETPNVIPVTVTVAIVIFVARELLESRRRRLANKRKLAAIRTQLAAECERTNWAIRWIRRAITDMRSAFERGKVVEVKKTALGANRLVFRTIDGQSSSSVFPKAHSTIIDKYLFEVASFDAPLFGLMVNALEGVAELNHVLDSLLDYIGEKDQPWLEGWCDYASKEVGDSEEPILYLYESCTGKPLTTTRLR